MWNVFPLIPEINETEGHTRFVRGVGVVEHDFEHVAFLKGGFKIKGILFIQPCGEQFLVLRIANGDFIWHQWFTNNHVILPGVVSVQYPIMPEFVWGFGQTRTEFYFIGDDAHWCQELHIDDIGSLWLI
jgi:hypothetical protein